MPDQPDRIAGKATMVNALGLHARSAARIVQVTQNARAAVRVAHGSLEADATSVIDILTLACAVGETLEFSIEDPEDYDILKALVNLVKDGFGEPQV
ncbi:MAG: HPr family phosphocarrier protein [Desulfobacterales bacterium]|nr:HPr family phosphocarrier protein [Desulfobacterales bacterium]